MRYYLPLGNDFDRFTKIKQKPGLNNLCRMQNRNFLIHRNRREKWFVDVFCPLNVKYVVF